MNNNDDNNNNILDIIKINVWMRKKVTNSTNRLPLQLQFYFVLTRFTPLSAYILLAYNHHSAHMTYMHALKYKYFLYKILTHYPLCFEHLHSITNVYDYDHYLPLLLHIYIIFENFVTAKFHTRYAKWNKCSLK